MDKKISVIVPFYNCEKYIFDCISSILNNSYKNLEVIAINDGSTDNSLKIVKKYNIKDKRIRVLEQANSGVSAARNRSIDEATGDYICFIDGDDYISVDFLKN